jgi:hypothetical protein
MENNKNAAFRPFPAATATRILNRAQYTRISAPLDNNQPPLDRNGTPITLRSYHLGIPVIPGTSGLAQNLQRNRTTNVALVGLFYMLVIQVLMKNGVRVKTEGDHKGKPKVVATCYALPKDDDEDAKTRGTRSIGAFVFSLFEILYQPGEYDEEKKERAPGQGNKLWAAVLGKSKERFVELDFPDMMNYLRTNTDQFGAVIRKKAMLERTQAENNACWTEFFDMCNMENFKVQVGTYAPEWFDKWKADQAQMGPYDGDDGYGDAACPIPLEQVFSLNNALKYIARAVRTTAPSVAYLCSRPEAFQARVPVTGLPYYFPPDAQSIPDRCRPATDCFIMTSGLLHARSITENCFPLQIPLTDHKKTSRDWQNLVVNNPAVSDDDIDRLFNYGVRNVPGAAATVDWLVNNSRQCVHQIIQEQNGYDYEARLATRVRICQFRSQLIPKLDMAVMSGNCDQDLHALHKDVTNKILSPEQCYAFICTTRVSFRSQVDADLLSDFFLGLAMMLRSLEGIKNQNLGLLMIRVYFIASIRDNAQLRVCLMIDGPPGCGKSWMTILMQNLMSSTEKDRASTFSSLQAGIDEGSSCSVEVTDEVNPDNMGSNGRNANHAKIASDKQLKASNHKSIQRQSKDEFKTLRSSVNNYCAYISLNNYVMGVLMDAALRDRTIIKVTASSPSRDMAKACDWACLAGIQLIEQQRQALIELLSTLRLLSVYNHVMQATLTVSTPNAIAVVVGVAAFSRVFSRITNSEVGKIPTRLRVNLNRFIFVDCATRAFLSVIDLGLYPCAGTTGGDAVGFTRPLLEEKFTEDVFCINDNRAFNFQLAALIEPMLYATSSDVLGAIMQLDIGLPVTERLIAEALWRYITERLKVTVNVSGVNYHCHGFFPSVTMASLATSEETRNAGRSNGVNWCNALSPAVRCEWVAKSIAQFVINVTQVELMEKHLVNQCAALLTARVGDTSQTYLHYEDSRNELVVHTALFTRYISRERMIDGFQQIAVELGMQDAGIYDGTADVSGRFHPSIISLERREVKETSVVRSNIPEEERIAVLKHYLKPFFYLEDHYMPSDHPEANICPIGSMLNKPGDPAREATKLFKFITADWSPDALLKLREEGLTLALNHTTMVAQAHQTEQDIRMAMSEDSIKGLEMRKKVDDAAEHKALVVHSNDAVVVIPDNPTKDEIMAAKDARLKASAADDQKQKALTAHYNIICTRIREQLSLVRTELKNCTSSDKPISVSFVEEGDNISGLVETGIIDPRTLDELQSKEVKFKPGSSLDEMAAHAHLDSLCIPSPKHFYAFPPNFRFLRQSLADHKLCSKRCVRWYDRYRQVRENQRLDEWLDETGAMALKTIGLVISLYRMRASPCNPAIRRDWCVVEPLGEEYLDLLVRKYVKLAIDNKWYGNALHLQGDESSEMVELINGPDRQLRRKHVIENQMAPRGEDPAPLFEENDDDVIVVPPAPVSPQKKRKFEEPSSPATPPKKRLRFADTEAVNDDTSDGEDDEEDEKETEEDRAFICDDNSSTSSDAAAALFAQHGMDGPKPRDFSSRYYEDV